MTTLDDGWKKYFEARDTAIDRQFVEMKEEMAQMRKDFKDGLQPLERFRWQIMGGAGLLAAFVSLVVSVWK